MTLTPADMHAATLFFLAWSLAMFLSGAIVWMPREPPDDRAA